MLALIASVAFAAAPAALTPAEKAAAKSISADFVRAHIRFLASDLLEGRGPATRGDRLAQEYIAAQFESLGLKPAAPNGGYFQPFDLVGVDGHPKTMSVSGNGKKLELKYADDFLAFSGTQQGSSRLDNAELVFVGYGIVAPEYQWDDFKGMDLRGKVLLVLNNDPEEDPQLFAGKTRLWYGRWDYKYLSAAKTGAAGAIIIHTQASAGYPWQVVRTSWAGEQFELPQTPGEIRLQVRGWTTEETTRRVLAMTGKDLDALRASAQKRDFRPVPLGVTVTTSFTNTVQKKQTANVLALLPGSDPKLSREVLIYTAHHDHLGIVEGVKAGSDSIYNGAQDNAAGVASMLAVARAFASMPKAPRRSILFAAVAAEEQGLLGSQYLAEHPPVPHGAMAANINLDGANIWGRTRDLTMIGMGKSNLDALVHSLAATQGRVVKPDQMPDRGFFYRSDQFNFAKIGVPALYFGSGMEFIGRPEGWGKKLREEWEERDYHQPSDQLTERWDLSGAVEDTQLSYFIGHRIAQAEAMPQWNKGDEFELPRKKALESLTSATGQ